MTRQADVLEAGAKGSADLWLTAAYDSLIETGIDSVRIMPLAKRLNLSRTSFYWFFRDRDALLDALLNLWRDKNTGGIVKQAGAYADSIGEAILNVMDCWLNPTLFDSSFEFAVRSWGLQSSGISAELHTADQVRITALADMFARFGYDVAEADVRARTIYLTQIGYISMKTREDVATRMRRMPNYIKIFTGVTPTIRELDRFFSRHGYNSAELAQPRRRSGKLDGQHG